MNVLFSCGNAPGLPTGYGGQGLLALQALQKLGAHVSVLAWNLSPSVFKPFERYTTDDVVRMQSNMKTIFDTAGSETVNWADVRWFCNPYTQFPTPIRKQDLNRMIASVDADLFLSLQDIFMFQPGAFLCLSAVWMPLHFLPVEHPTVLSLADFDMQLPISGWGSMLLQPLHDKIRQGTPCMRHIEVLPHGRDISIYKPPCADMDAALAARMATRQRWNWPKDAFVVFMIASNSEESGRKAFDAQFQGYRKFADEAERQGKQVWLHVHSETARAYDLGRLLETFGCYSGRSAFIDFTDQRARTHRDAVIVGHNCSVSHASDLLQVKEAELVSMYHASDVLLAATCSEGCGVPVLEAQLCGTPVVTTRATAMWEETMFGIAVRPRQWIARMDFNSGWYLPDSEGIGDALSEILTWSAEHKRDLFNSAYPKLVKEYGNETVIRRFQEILSKVDDWTFSMETLHSANRNLDLDEERKMQLATAVKCRKLWKQLMQLEEDLTQECVREMKLAKETSAIQYLKTLV